MNQSPGRWALPTWRRSYYQPWGRADKYLSAVVFGIIKYYSSLWVTQMWRQTASTLTSDLFGPNSNIKMDELKRHSWHHQITLQFAWDLLRQTAVELVLPYLCWVLVIVLRKESVRTEMMNMMDMISITPSKHIDIFSAHVSILMASEVRPRRAPCITAWCLRYRWRSLKLFYYQDWTTRTKS